MTLTGLEITILKSQDLFRFLHKLLKCFPYGVDEAFGEPGGPVPSDVGDVNRLQLPLAPRHHVRLRGASEVLLAGARPQTDAVHCGDEHVPSLGKNTRIYTTEKFRLTQTIWCFPLKLTFINQMNIKYSQGIDKVINNDFYCKY